MYFICFEDDCLILYNSQKINKALQFKYSPFTITETDNTRIRSPDIHFCALLGVKILDDIPFILIAQEATSSCNIGTSVVYEIKKIQWIPVVRKQQIETVLNKTQEKIRDMAKLFEDGYHYYSDLYKLHTTYYFNIVSEQNAEERKFYSQFIFNQNLMNLDQHFSIAAWCKPIIQGYVEQFVDRITSTQNICYTIISRRSYKKQGTRYFARGIDDKGNVANFTQTQQIISYGKFIISNIQIRGSVPAFFQQLGVSGLGGQLNISRNQAMTQKAFQTHFNRLNSVYGRIFCVNLLSIKKSEQQKLTVFYQNLISSYSPPDVKYQYFDFHEQCKNNEFQNSQRLVEKIKKVIDNFGVTVFDTKLKKLVTKQTGVVRTNCLDCLDRTNYMQSRIALHQFQKVIINFSKPDTRQQIFKNQIFKNKLELSSEVLKKFNSAWAQNGDKISLHYTGIGSTHTDITKNGKRTLQGTVNHKMRSLMRFFVQFTDSKKHEAIQTIVTNPLLISNYSQIKMPEGQFMNMALMSFDLNQKSNETEYNEFIENYIELKRPAGVVIYVYGKKQNGIFTWFTGNKPHQDIKNFIQESAAVVRRLGYQVIKKVFNENSSMIILGNQIIIPNVTELKNQNINIKEDSMIICKFNIFRSSMVFSGVNCETFQGFVKLIQKAHTQAFQFDKLGQARSSSILTHNYRTIMGNTASGNKFQKTHIQDIKKQGEWMNKNGDMKGFARLVSSVLDKDQLANSFSENYQYLKNYMQGPPTFISQGNRIIFWNKEKLITKVLDYKANTKTQCTYGLLSYQL